MVNNKITKLFIREYKHQHTPTARSRPLPAAAAIAAGPRMLTTRLCTAAPRSGVQSLPAGAGPAWEQLEGQ